MNTQFESFVEWAGGIRAAAEKLECSEILVRHICNGRRSVSKAVAQKAHTVSSGQFDRCALIFDERCKK